MAKKRKKKISKQYQNGGVSTQGMPGINLDFSSLEGLDLSSLGQGGFLNPLGGQQSQGDIGQIAGLLQNLMRENLGPNQSRLNVDPLNDINKFKVKPSRGFLSFQGGGRPTKDANNARVANQLGGQQEVQPLSLLLPLAEGQQLLSNFGTPALNQITSPVDIDELKKGGKVSKMQDGGVPTDSTAFDLVLEKLGEPAAKVQEMLDRISFHETGPKQRMEATAKQLGGGPGRGLFMFEPDSLKTAANRYKRFAKKNDLPIPQFVSNIRKGDRDASKLSADQQKEIFLVDQLERRGGKDLKATLAGNLPLDKFWRKNVWAGPKRQEDVRLKSFNASQDAFESEYTFNGGDLPEVSVVAPRVAPNPSNQIQQDNTQVLPFNVGGMAVQGYKDNSPFKNLPQIEIPSNTITMNGVGQDLLLLPDGDEPKLAKANSGIHKFPNSSKVLEIPSKQLGGLPTLPNLEGLSLNSKSKEDAIRTNTSPTRRVVFLLESFDNGTTTLKELNSELDTLGVRAKKLKSKEDVSKFTDEFFEFQNIGRPTRHGLFQPEFPRRTTGNLQHGGIPQAGIGGFFKKIGKGIGKGVSAVAKGVKDVALFGVDNATNLLLGTDLIKDGAYSYGVSKNVSGATGNALNKIGDVAIPLAATLVNPGLGAAIGGIRGTTNALGDGKNFGQALSQGLMSAGTSFLGAKALGSQGGIGQIPNNFMNLFKGGQGVQNGLNLGQNILGALNGGGGQSAGFSTPGFTGLPQGLNFNYNDQAPVSNTNLLGGLFGNVRRFEDGGFVGLDLGPFIPIQTEKVGNLPEQLLHLDGTITDVHATKSHKKMDDDEVTDLVMEGTYVASAAKSMYIKKKDTEDIVIGVKHYPYKEDHIGEIPELWTFDSLFKNKSKLRPAELALEIKKKFPLVDREGVRDPFVLKTNKENLVNRAPWLVNLIQLNEEKRTKKEGGKFKQGGYPEKFQLGGLTGGDLLGILGTAAPLLGSIFGNGQQNPNIDPLARGLALGSLPLAATGLTQNIRSRQGALDNALTNFTGLTSDLQGLNNQGTLAGVGGRLLQDTQLPRLNLDTSRLQNFNTRTPRSFANALSTPSIDITSALGQLGSRAGLTLAGNVNSQGIRSRNQTLASQFNQDRNLDFNIQNQITNIRNGEQQYNNQLAQQEVGNRNSVISGIAGDIQGNLQNQGSILSNAFNVGTNLDFQRAALAGQIPIGLAQTLQNGAGLLQSFYGNPTDQASLGGNSNFASYLESLQVGNRQNTNFGQPTATDPTISNSLPAPVTLGQNTGFGANGYGFGTPPYVPTAQDIYGG